MIPPPAGPKLTTSSYCGGEGLGKGGPCPLCSCAFCDAARWQDLADAFEAMHQKRRYRDVFFIADTCEAATLQHAFYSPNIISVGSSRKGENSYSLVSDKEVCPPVPPSSPPPFVATH